VYCPTSKKGNSGEEINGKKHVGNGGGPKSLDYWKGAPVKGGEGVYVVKGRRIGGGSGKRFTRERHTRAGSAGKKKVSGFLPATEEKGEPQNLKLLPESGGKGREGA